jgi:hypothetical protein
MNFSANITVHGALINLGTTRRPSPYILEWFSRVVARYHTAKRNNIRSLMQKEAKIVARGDYGAFETIWEDLGHGYFTDLVVGDTVYPWHSRLLETIFKAIIKDIDDIIDFSPPLQTVQLAVACVRAK